MSRDGWRQSFLYFYNYEKEFPYTPNVRGIRTADWKYIHYPHGDGSPDRYQAELYHHGARRRYHQRAPEVLTALRRASFLAHPNLFTLPRKSGLAGTLALPARCWPTF